MLPSRARVNGILMWPYFCAEDGRDGHGADVRGGTVGFDRAEFSGGTVDFSDPLGWSFPPAFPWTDTPAPGVKLPHKEDQSQE